jgi:acetyl-CoA carboxylase beta subunit
MAWPDIPDDFDVNKINEFLESHKDKTMTCPHCDSLVYKEDVKELGYCPECEEELE